MHGAGGGHGAGKANPAYKHGIRSREFVEMRKATNDMVRSERDLAALIDERAAEDPLICPINYALGQ
jgi:hypothetical protein